MPEACGRMFDDALLSGYVDGALPQMDEQLVRVHLEDCETCRKIVTDLVGGEIAEYTKLLAESREQALDRMASEARRLGANGVFEVRFATSMVMTGAAELLAYGTAVVLDDER